MKKYILGLFLFCSLFLAACNKQTIEKIINQKQGVTSFEMGQIYRRGDGMYFKLVDEDTCVDFRDDASKYKTEDDLNDANSGNDNQHNHLDRDTVRLTFVVTVSILK